MSVHADPRSREPALQPPLQPDRARHRLIVGMYRGLYLLSGLVALRDLLFAAEPWVFLPPALASLALAYPAYVGATGAWARIWLIAVAQGLAFSTSLALGAQTAQIVVITATFLSFLCFDWTEKKLLGLSVAAGSVNLALVTLAPWFGGAGPALGSSAGGQHGFVVAVNFVVVVLGAAWFAHTLGGAVAAARSRANQLAVASAAKSRFLATMSHELRTPAAAILGFADLLQLASVAPQERLRHAAVVARNGRHLLALLDDLLDLSKLDAGELAIELEEVDVATLVFDAVQTTRAREDVGHQLDFTCLAETSYPTVVCIEPRRAQQILLNLLSNAAKFARSKVTVTLRWSDEGPEAHLAFLVDDDGPGIPEHEEPFLFDAFWQGEAGKHSKMGTGLGLMLCRRLAEVMGGSLHLERRDGPGARFAFTVPTTQPPLGVVGPLNAPEPTSLPPPTELDDEEWLAGVSFLLAEDNADLRTLLSFELSRRGAQVTTVGDGQDALDALVEPYPNLILMDVDMPRMDGLTATRILRQRGVRTPIVALTAFAMKGDRERCLEAGCDAYHGKPVDMRQLLHTVADLCHLVPPDASQITRMDPSVAAALLEVEAGYVRKLPARMAELEALLVSTDWEGLAAAAHKLAGSAGSFGLPEISEAARALEEAARPPADAEESASAWKALREACPPPHFEEISGEGASR